MTDISGKGLKIAIGGIWHETNVFASLPTTLADFECHEGDALMKSFCDTRTPLGGYIDWSRRNPKIEMIPAFFASAVPSGMVSKDAYSTLSNRLIHVLRRIAPDIILLDLHGAMVVEGVDDVESDLLVRLRGRFGRIPIGAVLDYHANISAAFVDLVDFVSVYKTYPHTDLHDRGVEVAALTYKAATSTVRPIREIVKPPLMIAPQAQFTAMQPMSKLMSRAAEMEQLPGVLNVSIAAGFPYADVPHAGLSVIVTTNNNREQAQWLASKLAQQAWSMRTEFLAPALSALNAVKQALRSKKAPVVLVDSADNIGGGAPGDGTVLLEELLRVNASGAVVSIADPQALVEITRAGVGATVHVRIGGKTDAYHGKPVEVSGTVLRIACGDFSYHGSYMTARRVNAGMAAVLKCGEVTIVVRERKVMPFDSEELRVLGIEPAHCRIIVVKSAIAWRAAYGSIAQEVIEAGTPGICSANLSSLPFKHVRRPVAPLDARFEWQVDGHDALRS